MSRKPFYAIQYFPKVKERLKVETDENEDIVLDEKIEMWNMIIPEQIKSFIFHSAFSNKR